MSELGHSRPMHPVPVPINVRCYSNSDMIVWRSEVTLRSLSDIGEYLKGENFYSLKEGQAKLLPPAAGYATLRSLFGGAMGMLG